MAPPDANGQQRNSAEARVQTGANQNSQKGPQTILDYVRSLLNNQQENIADLLTEQRSELLGKVGSKKHRFRQRIL